MTDLDWLLDSVRSIHEEIRAAVVAACERSSSATQLAHGSVSVLAAQRNPDVGCAALDH